MRALPSSVLGPVDSPPWKRQRCFPGTTLMMHGTPARVFARHLGRYLRFKGSPLGDRPRSSICRHQCLSRQVTSRHARPVLGQRTMVVIETHSIARTAAENTPSAASTVIRIAPAARIRFAVISLLSTAEHWVLSVRRKNRLLRDMRVQFLGSGQWSSLKHTPSHVLLQKIRPQRPPLLSSLGRLRVSDSLSS